MSGDDVGNLIATTARALLDDLNQITADLAARMGDAVHAMSPGPELPRENKRSITGNVHSLLSAWAQQLPMSAIPIASENVDLVRSLLHQGTPLEALLRPYRAGLPLFWRTWTEAVASRTTNQAALVNALLVTHAELSSYFDRTLDAVVAEYEAERERWVGHDLARRSEAIRAILADDGTTADTHSVEHRFELEQTAIIFWADSPTSTDQLDRAGSAMAYHHNARSFVSMPVSTRSVWVWLATAQPIPEQEFTMIDPIDQLRGAVGRSARGLEGFRLSHAQALGAQQVALRQGPTAFRMTVYGLVEVAALLMSANEVVVASFVRRELGELAANNDSVRQLRATLAVYLAEGHNAPRTADQMFLHRNTILYRIGRAEELLPNPLRERQLEIQLALRLVDLVDEPVIDRASDG